MLKIAKATEFLGKTHFQIKSINRQGIIIA